LARPGCNKYNTNAEEGLKCGFSGGPSYYVERRETISTIGKPSTFDWTPTYQWNDQKHDYVESGKRVTNENDDLKWMVDKMVINKNKKKLENITFKTFDYGKTYVSVNILYSQYTDPFYIVQYNNGHKRKVYLMYSNQR
jgi:hypothetical protein